MSAPAETAATPATHFLSVGVFHPKYSSCVNVIANTKMPIRALTIPRMAVLLRNDYSGEVFACHALDHGPGVLV